MEPAFDQFRPLGNEHACNLSAQLSGAGDCVNSPGTVTDTRLGGVDD